MSEKKVILYSIPTCPNCKKTKEFLSQKGISYDDYDVSKNTEKSKEMFKKTGQMGVPVIVVGDEIMVGFNKSKLEDALSK